MTQFYEVDVQRRGRPFRTIHVAHANAQPELACACAEALVCETAEGSLYNLADYFANAVRELSAADYVRPEPNQALKDRQARHDKAVMMTRDYVG